MGLLGEVDKALSNIFDVPMQIRDGRKVPETEEIGMMNGGVRLNATYLYADMAESSFVAQIFPDHVASRIIRGYVTTAARVIRAHGGVIKSFDGDRVMGIFHGQDMNSRAVVAAFVLNWFVAQRLRLKIDLLWPQLRPWTLNHGVGIASGQSLLVRGGVRSFNDTISIGHAPNVAAKFSEFRNCPINITSHVYRDIGPGLKFLPNSGLTMWLSQPDSLVGGLVFEVLGSTWALPPLPNA